MNNSPEKRTYLGSVYALSAFFFWGFAPAYWKQISDVSAGELLGHRIVWGFLTLGLILTLKSGFKKIIEIIMKADRWLFLSSLLIFANWGIFVWAVNNNMIVDVSLGYYLNPLFNILAGFLIFKESMRPLKFLAIALAFGGVGILFVYNSGRPDISLILAATFCLYGVLKKKSPLTAEDALFYEFSFWLIPILFYFFYLGLNQEFIFIQKSPMMMGYLFLAGMVTIFPLWLFNNAIKNLELGTLGFLQYLTPSLHLLLGVLIYGEVFDRNRLFAFGFIWVGIFFYLIDGMKKKNGNKLSRQEF